MTKAFPSVAPSLLRRGLTAMLAACAAAMLLSPGAARSQQAWPSQPVKLVVPYAPGGTTDLIARRLSDRLGRELGQPVIVENKPGAATNLGACYVASARNDGHTLLLGSVFQVLNSVFGPEPGCDFYTALDPVSRIADMPFVLAANPARPWRNGRDLVAAAKAAPRKLSVSHAQLETSLGLLNAKAGMELLLVPYKGGGPATTDAVSGQVDMVYALVPVLLPQIQAGKLRPLAVTSAQRFPGLPDVPSFVESGVDFDMGMWYGVFVPHGAPPAVMDRLASATRKVMTDPEMIESIRAAGAVPTATSPADFRAQIQKEHVSWQAVAKAMPSLVVKQ